MTQNALEIHEQNVDYTPLELFHQMDTGCPERTFIVLLPIGYICAAVSEVRNWDLSNFKFIKTVRVGDENWSYYE